MSDSSDKTEDAADKAEESGPVGGERLAEARRKQQVPLLDIAKELHLDEYKVRAIENNDYEVLGAPVFAKGHLKKYAQLVGVDEKEVLADYYELQRAETAPPVLKTRPRSRREISPGPWIAAIVAIGLVFVAYWWFAIRIPATTSEQTGLIQALPEGENDAVNLPDPEQPEQSEEESAPADTDDVAEESGEVIAEPAPEPVEEPLPAVTEVAELQLAIAYSGDCWTEISDAAGRRLFFDLGSEGRTVNLSGEPPFNVLFGNADFVSLTVNGNPFSIPGASRRGKTARFTILEQ